MAESNNRIDDTASDISYLGVADRLKLFISLYWKSFIVVLAPILLLPVTLVNNEPPYRCMYVVLLMAIYWCSEALPLPVTSVLPIVLFPLMSIMETGTTCTLYMTDAIVLFIAGLVLALAVQNVNLHKRLALLMIKLIGCSQRRLHFGLILYTTFISMWISNTAACAMMIPIMKAILEEFEGQGLCKLYTYKDTETAEKGMLNPSKPEERKSTDKLPTKITICYYLSAAYASSLGGCGSPVGSGTNMALKGLYDEQFPNDQMDFGKWILFNIPLMLINITITWLYLQWYFMGMFRPNSEEAKEYNLGIEGEQIARNVIIKRYKEMGPISQQEKQVAAIFVLSVFLLFTRSPKIFVGWADWLTGLKTGDATTGIIIVFLLFLLPGNWHWLSYFKCTSYGTVPKEGKAPALITWKYVEKNLPWGLIFLLGGGVALSKGGKVTGMSALLGGYLSNLAGLPAILILLLLCMFAQFATEFAVNVAIAQLMLPPICAMARAIKIHPLYFMLPVGMSCSMAFHTPVGTPPNALAAGLANIQNKDIAMAGIGPTLITLITYWLSMDTWGRVIYPDTTSFPSWAKPNSTLY